MTEFYQTDNKSALEAITDAQRIAFGPFLFQAAVALDNLGILKCVDESGQEGTTTKQIAENLTLTEYGTSVLLDAGLSIGVVYLKEEKFVLTKMGHFLLHDKMTRVNFEFSRDFCYRGLDQLHASIENGKPEGLKEFTDKATVYPALSTLPEPAKSSWFNFDHFYSDNAFQLVLPKIFDMPVQHLIDCGGNTGKWSLQCVKYNEDVQVTILDLPQQIELMKENIAGEVGAERISGQPIDFLADNSKIPSGADVIWMSQFLDCFSEDQIQVIVGKAIDAMSDKTRFCILETFWDKQPYEAGSLSLNCTSLYFSCFANGNSRMYRANVFKRLLVESGLVIEQQFDNLGKGHSLLICKKQ